MVKPTESPVHSCACANCVRAERYSCKLRVGSSPFVTRRFAPLPLDTRAGPGMGVRDRRNDLPSPAAVRESGVSLQGTSLTPFVRTLDPSPDWPGVRNFFATLSAQPAYNTHTVEELRLIDYGRAGSTRSAYSRTLDHTSNPPLAFAAISAMPVYDDVSHEEIRLDDYWYHGVKKPVFEYDFDIEPDSNLSVSVPVLSLNSFDVPSSAKLRRHATAAPSFAKSWGGPTPEKAQYASDKSPSPAPPLPPAPVEPSSPPEPVSPHAVESPSADEEPLVSIRGAPPRAATFATSRDQLQDVDKADLLKQLQAMYLQAEEITASSDTTNAEEKLKSLRERAQMFNRALGLMEDDTEPEQSERAAALQESDAAPSVTSPHADVPELPKIEEESEDDIDNAKFSLASQKIFPSVLALPDSPSSEVHEVTANLPDELHLPFHASSANTQNDTEKSYVSHARDPFLVSAPGDEEASASESEAEELELKNEKSDLPHHSLPNLSTTTNLFLEQTAPQKSNTVGAQSLDSNIFPLVPSSSEDSFAAFKGPDFLRHDASPNPFDDHVKKHSTDRPRTGQSSDFAFSVGRSSSKTGLAKSKSRSAIGRSGSTGGIRLLGSGSGLSRSVSRGALGRSTSSRPADAPTIAPAKKSKRRHSQLNAIGNAFGPNPTPFAVDSSKVPDSPVSTFSQQVSSETESTTSEMSDVSARPSSSMARTSEDSKFNNVREIKSLQVSSDTEMNLVSDQSKFDTETKERPKSMFAAALKKFEAVQPVVVALGAVSLNSPRKVAVETGSQSSLSAAMPTKSESDHGQTNESEVPKNDTSFQPRASRDPFKIASPMAETKCEQTPNFRQALQNLENNIASNTLEPKSYPEKSNSFAPSNEMVEDRESSPQIFDLQKSMQPSLPDQMMTTVSKRKDVESSLPSAPKEDLSLPLMAPSTQVTSHIAETLQANPNSPAPSSGNSVLSGAFETSYIKTASISNEPGSTASDSPPTFSESVDKESAPILKDESDMQLAKRSILSKGSKQAVTEEEEDDFVMKQSGRRVSFRVVDSAPTSDKSPPPQSDKSETSEVGGLDPTRKPAPLPPYAVSDGKHGNGEGYDSDSSNSEEFVDAAEDTVSSKASDRFWSKMRTSAKQRAAEAELEKISREALNDEYPDEEIKDELETSGKSKPQPIISDSIAKRMQVFLASEKTGSVVDDGVGTSSMTDSLVEESLRKSPASGPDAFRMLGGRFFTKKKKSTDSAGEENLGNKRTSTDNESASPRSRRGNVTAQRGSKTSSGTGKPTKQIKKSPSGSETKRARTSAERLEPLKEEIRKSLSYQTDSIGSSSKPKSSTRSTSKAKSSSLQAEPSSLEAPFAKKMVKDDSSSDRQVKQLGRKRDQKKGLPESMMKRMEAVTSLSDNRSTSSSSDGRTQSTDQGSNDSRHEGDSVKRKQKAVSTRRAKPSMSQREMMQRSGKKRSSATKSTSSSGIGNVVPRPKSKSSAAKSSRHVRIEPRAVSDILDPSRPHGAVGGDLAPRASSSILGLSKSKSRRLSRASAKKTSTNRAVDPETEASKVNAVSMAILPSAGDGRQISLTRRHSLPSGSLSNDKLAWRGRDLLDIDRARVDDTQSLNESGVPRSKRTQTMLSALWASGNNNREGSFPMPKMRRASTDLGPQHVTRQGSVHNAGESSEIADEPLRGGILSGVRRLFSRKLRRKERESNDLERQSIAGMPEGNGPRGSISRGSVGLRGSITRGSSGMRGSLTRGSTGARGSTERGSTGARSSLVGLNAARRAKSEHKNARRRAPLFG